MGWCTAQWKMLLFCAKTIVKDSRKFELARLKKKKKKKKKKKLWRPSALDRGLGATQTIKTTTNVCTKYKHVESTTHHRTASYLCNGKWYSLSRPITITTYGMCVRVVVALHTQRAKDDTISKFHAVIGFHQHFFMVYHDTSCSCETVHQTFLFSHYKWQSINHAVPYIAVASFTVQLKVKHSLLVPMCKI